MIFTLKIPQGKVNLYKWFWSVVHSYAFASKTGLDEPLHHFVYHFDFVGLAHQTCAQIFKVYDTILFFLISSRRETVTFTTLYDGIWDANGEKL